VIGRDIALWNVDAVVGFTNPRHINKNNNLIIAKKRKMEADMPSCVCRS
jgi:hypothetical protein